MLDSLHYNAHTTATDALWAGVPIVTLPGACTPCERVRTRLSTQRTLSRGGGVRLLGDGCVTAP